MVSIFQDFLYIDLKSKILKSDSYGKKQDYLSLSHHILKKLSNATDQTLYEEIH